MRTTLDEAHTWFLKELSYREGALELVLVEGVVSAETEDVRIGEVVIRDTRRVEPTAASRLARVRFAGPVAWQVVDESFTAFDSYELRNDTSRVHVLGRSRYLDFVLAHHGWFTVTRAPAQHYRVWTETEVIDVVACTPPEVTPRRRRRINRWRR